MTVDSVCWRRAVAAARRSRVARVMIAGWVIWTSHMSADNDTLTGASCRCSAPSQHRPDGYARPARLPAHPFAAACATTQRALHRGPDHATHIMTRCLAGSVESKRPGIPDHWIRRDLPDLAEGETSSPRNGCIEVARHAPGAASRICHGGSLQLTRSGCAPVRRAGCADPPTPRDLD
jgi:hypothetical protein